jgi:cation diffusion facilitator family transporter
MHRTSLFALSSVGIGVFVFGLKFAAYWLTGSVALLSDALESIINIAGALAAYIAVRVSQRPADANHPYGHHKAEYLSAVLEGVLIVVAALAILRESYLAVLTPRPLDAPWLGLAINAAAGVVNGVWAWMLLRQGREARSPALTADGRHLVADVITSVGVLVGVGLVALTGWLILDPLLAALVALNILWSGWRLVGESMSGLMDEAADADSLQRIRSVISTEAEGAMEAHDLRTRSAGAVTFIDFHLVVPGKMTVTAAHEICDRIELALRAAIEGARVTIHVEPEEKAKHAGIVVL